MSSETEEFVRELGRQVPRFQPLIDGNTASDGTLNLDGALREIAHGSFLIWNNGNPKGFSDARELSRIVGLVDQAFATKGEGVRALITESFLKKLATLNDDDGPGVRMMLGPNLTKAFDAL